MIGMSISERQWIFLGIGIILLIFSTVFFVPVYKVLIYNAVKKSLKEPLQIKLTFDDEGFMYELETAVDTEYPKYEYNNVRIVYSVKEYIYMYFTII
jgi:hypothetical protein